MQPSVPGEMRWPKQTTAGRIRHRIVDIEEHIRRGDVAGCPSVRQKPGTLAFVDRVAGHAIVISRVIAASRATGVKVDGRVPAVHDRVLRDGVPVGAGVDRVKVNCSEYLVARN